MTSTLKTNSKIVISLNDCFHDLQIYLKIINNDHYIVNNTWKL